MQTTWNVARCLLVFQTWQHMTTCQKCVTFSSATKQSLLSVPLLHRLGSLWLLSVPQNSLVSVSYPVTEVSGNVHVQKCVTPVLMMSKWFNLEDLLMKVTACICYMQMCNRNTPESLIISCIHLPVSTFCVCDRSGSCLITRALHWPSEYIQIALIIRVEVWLCANAAS